MSSVPFSVSFRSLCLSFFLFSIVIALDTSCYSSLFTDQRCPGVPEVRSLDCSANNVLMLGDSIIRNSFVQLLDLHHAETTKDWDKYKGHRSFSYELLPVSETNPVDEDIYSSAPLEGKFKAITHCLTSNQVQALWLPFASNITQFWNQELTNTTPLPEVIVFDVGLWDLLHIHDAVNFEQNISLLFTTIASWAHNLQIHDKTVPQLYMYNVGILEAEKNVPDKQMLREENGLVYSSILVNELRKQHISEIITMIDIHAIMSAVPAVLSEELTADGVHPSKRITDAFIQVLLHQINQHVKGKAVHGKSIRPEKLSLQEANKPDPKFVGRYPVLGFMVGIYTFAVLITGDIFLITHFLMSCCPKRANMAPFTN